MREIMAKLREKYNRAQQEIKDLKGEHQDNKADLLDAYRQLLKNNKFNQKVIGILLSENEIYKLNEKSKWEDDKQEWSIPLFTFNTKDKSLNFPTINAKSRVD